VKQKLLQQFATRKDVASPQLNFTALDKGQALVWDISLNVQPQIITTKKFRQLNQRHIKKYATGFMDYNSFYFTRTQDEFKSINVLIFVQLAGGIDDETWMYHLKQNVLNC